MSDLRKKYWRERLGIGPGDKFTACDGKEYLIADIRTNNRGNSIDFTSCFRNEHGTLYNIFDMIDWSKTNLYNEQGQILGKCKRNCLEDPTIYAYEPIFTPKRHKLKMYKVRIPGLDSTIIKYTPKEFEERFEIIEPFSEGAQQ
jgi:hypothetical protein